ncbi:MAG: HAD-IIIC family phosphatase [Acidimicrobiales bacterium]
MTPVKCVVWDLDNTVWSGVLLEGDDVEIRGHVRDTIDTLDQRGILHSVASRNDPEAALAKLDELGLADYFLHPMIGWSTKSSSINAIAEALNIGLAAIAFVDDDPFERAEVANAHPEVRGIDADAIGAIPDRDDMHPPFVTTDSQMRRRMYQDEARRVEAAEDVPADGFLASLDMVMTITQAGRDDLERIHELTERTNQLNSTGYTYSFDELDELRSDPNHMMLIAGLDDCFGSYGKIGFALVETRDDSWLLKALLMSCRVMSRGVGVPLLADVARRAGEADCTLRAEFIRTDRNRFLYLTFKLSGFREVERTGDVAVLERDADLPVEFPDHLEIRREP